MRSHLINMSSNHSRNEISGEDFSGKSSRDEQSQKEFTRKLSKGESPRAAFPGDAEILYSLTPGQNVTEQILRDCAANFSAHYGVWSDHAARNLGAFAVAGTSIRTESRTNSMLILLRHTSPHDSPATQSPEPTTSSQQPPHHRNPPREAHRALLRQPVDARRRPGLVGYPDPGGAGTRGAESSDGGI